MAGRKALILLVIPCCRLDRPTSMFRVPFWGLFGLDLGPLVALKTPGSTSLYQLAVTTLQTAPRQEIWPSVRKQFNNYFQTGRAVSESRASVRSLCSILVSYYLKRLAN